LWLAYFPVGWGWLCWVALVPLVSLIRTRIRTAVLAWSAWVGGSVFFWSSLQWLRVADYRMYATWAALAIYCSLFFPVAVCVIRRLDRKTHIPLVVTLPTVWTALEYFRAHFATGFPWYFLGHSQHDWPTVTQIADLGGVYAVSFVVAAVNALCCELLWSVGWYRRLFVLPEPQRGWPWKLASQAVVVIGLVAATIAYGLRRLEEPAGTPGPRVALLQGNIPQSARNDVSSDTTAEQMFRHFADLSDQAMAQKPLPDLIVWPETSFPGDWMESAPGQPDDSSKQFARQFVERWPSNILLGLNSIIAQPGGTRFRYNSAVLLGKNGRPQGRYDKIHRVPFGEYVPLREAVPFMNWFAPYDFDYSIMAGERLTLFHLGDYRFGVLICYEDTDPYLARQYVRPGAGDKADFLVNISNDGWFNGTSEHEQHLAICRFRAIESRRAVVRAVNMGVSAIIDGNGRVLTPQEVRKAGQGSQAGTWQAASAGDSKSWAPSEWGKLKKVPALLSGVIPIDHRTSLYALWGDWLPGACWLVVVVGLAMSFLRPAA
jgi:apolipoprotein N-acyltransferase